jgi:hypothetical protein
MRTIIAAALLTLATPVMAQEVGMTSRQPPQWMRDAAMQQPSIEDELKTEEGRRHACGVYNIVMAPDWDGNLGGDPAQRAEWCKSQPAAIRHKYGSRY